MLRSFASPLKKPPTMSLHALCMISVFMIL